MYSLKLAAGNGHLELCRFLLQESSLFHRDEPIRDARQQLLRHASHKRDNRRAVQMVKEVIELLATVSGLDADIDLENFEALGVFYEMVLFTLAESPLITLPVANIPFAKRFAIATEAHGWHPEFFATAFRGEEWAMFVTHASESGRTALHWAAEHYGLSRSYDTLVMELIRQGSDVHACCNGFPWDRPMFKVSPFLAFLHHTSDGRGWSTTANLVDAVSRWGQVLVDAGQSLRRYAAAENDLIQANRKSFVRTLNGQMFAPVGLVVLGENRLALRVEHIFDVSVWKAVPRHVPGAWPASATSHDPSIWMPDLPNTIIWHPEDKDEREGFRWVFARTVNIKVDPFLVDPAGKSDLIKVGTSRGSNKHNGNIEDDHDPSLITMMNAARSKQRVQTYTRRRSASAPAVVHEPQVGRHRSGFPEPWNGTRHQCALDVRWRMSDSDTPSLRNCMQTRCREWTGSFRDQWFFTWEARLLEDERHVQMARRFARRFCPERLYVAERTLARATERSRLQIGPPRPLTQSW